MVARGYREDFARRIYQQILGFGEYGFPESHAASFALLVYVSAWLKCHHPAAFFAALLAGIPFISLFPMTTAMAALLLKGQDTLTANASLPTYETISAERLGDFQTPVS